LGGVIPLLGFIGKEEMFKAVLHAPDFKGFMLVLSLGTSILVVAVAAIVALRPFFGELKPTPKKPHEAPPSMLGGPLVLAGLSLLLGLMPSLAGQGVLEAAVSAVMGESVSLHLALWHGVNAPLLMSAASLIFGLAIYWGWDRVRTALGRMEPLFSHGPEWGYERLMDGLVKVSDAQTRLLQNGYIRSYVVMTLTTFLGLTGYTLLFRYSPDFSFRLDASWHEIAVVLLMCAGAIGACLTRSRLAAVVATGIMGFCIALIFILFSAPDLGITQLLVETLTAILMILVLFRLPRFARLSTPLERARDFVVAVATGGLVTLLLLMAIDVNLFPSISDYMIENSEPLGHGLNIVNVILVDIRALDTMGEIFVLALAAIGAFAMLKLRPKETQDG
jgi:multicomponent Na+:H+ antiporter subunit A